MARCYPRRFTRLTRRVTERSIRRFPRGRILGRGGGSFLAVLLATLASITSPTPSRAGTGWITGNDFGVPEASNSIVLPCDQPDSIQLIYVTVEPSIDVPGFQDFELDLVLNSSEHYLFCGNDPPPPFGPFWVFSAPEATCNEGGLQVTNETPAVLHGYHNLWQGDAGSILTASALNSSSREAMAVYIHRPTPIDLVAGKRYYAATLKLPMCTAQGCAGCDGGVLLTTGYWHLRGAGGADDPISTTYMEMNIFGVCGVTPPPNEPALEGVRSRLEASLRPPVEASSVCNPVPVQRHTWGELKLLYR